MFNAVYKYIKYIEENKYTFEDSIPTGTRAILFINIPSKILPKIIDESNV